MGQAAGGRSAPRGPAGRRAVAVAAAVVVAAVAAACAPPPPAPPTPLPERPTGAQGDPRAPVPSCTAAAMRSCALPFPTDEFTVADPSTATGRRVRVPDQSLPAAVRSQLGPGATIAEVFADADGFPALTPVVFELDRGVDAASLPADGGDVLRVFDTSTGRAVPIRAELGADAARLGAAGTIVQAWPRTRWEPGRTYVARVTDGLTSPAGPPRRAPGMDEPGPLAAIRADLARWEGDRWDRVVQATRFTVRSNADATRTIDRLAAAARAADHPVRDLFVGAPLFVEGASAVVSGEVQLSDFRDADGVVRPDRPPTPSWERFVLVVPERPAGPDGAPVLVYGHGLTAFKETMLAVASTNARRGVATIGIDVPNHGDRTDEGGSLLSLASPGSLGRLASMPLQGVVDHVSLVEAVTDHLDGLDLAPWRFDGDHGDGAVDLDTSRLLYAGTSMGGVLGASEAALLPELEGAFLQVAGTGITDIITHSVLWLLFVGVVPADVTAGDGAALLAAAGALFDTADHVNLVDRLGPDGPPVFVQYGVGDQIVPNVNTERMASLLGLPRVGPQVAPWRLEVPMPPPAGDLVPPDGRGVAQVRNSGFADEVQFVAGHLSFLDPVAVAYLDAWLANRLAASGLDGGPVTGS